MTTTSMRNFSVHFRRSPNYKGEYGFDWLRDEYIYDVETVAEVNAKTRLYRGDVHELIKEYTHFNSQFAEPLKKVEKAHGEQYIPAWLALVPKSNKVLTNHSANLYLQIEQDIKDSFTPLDVNDTTQLVFEASTGISVNKSTIALKDFLSQAQSSTKVLKSTAKGLVSKNFIRYTNNKLAITVTCTQVLTNVGFVKVYAKKGDTQKLVGLLLCYPNAKIPRAEIIEVHISSKLGTQLLTVPTNYKTYLKSFSFNQALVQAEVTNTSFLNVVKTWNDLNSKKTLTADEIIQKDKLKTFLAKYPAGKIIPKNKVEGALNDIIALYESFSKVYAKNGIAHKDNKRTFLIFTDYDVDRIYGYADTDGETCVAGLCRLNWGNATVIFKAGLPRLVTIVHELAHTFSLPHSFQPFPESKHTFYQGYTDNVMDYSYQLDKNKKAGDDNPKERISLYKWQWEIIRNDKSMQ